MVSLLILLIYNGLLEQDQVQSLPYNHTGMIDFTCNDVLIQSLKLHIAKWYRKTEVMTEIQADQLGSFTGVMYTYM